MLMSIRKSFFALLAAVPLIILFMGFQFYFHVKHAASVRQLRLNNSVQFWMDNSASGRHLFVQIVTKNNSARQIRRSKTVILLYTPFYGNPNWVNREDKCIWYQPEERQCSLDLFEITSDKARFSDSDLVVFHARDMPNFKELKSLLKNRPTSQRWVYTSWESPILTADTSPYNGLFNLTWTYRTDSDFWIPYGHYEPLTEEETKKNEMAIMKDYTHEKSELVAWVVSNCVPQFRLSFVRELKAFIKVDVYGACSGEFGHSNWCPHGRTSDCIRKYKFYLAFENAFCEDYITEKYWGNLGDQNGIPIVMGGANYTKLAIPGSYINIMDFKTVEQLAGYLHYLDKNTTAYNAYFKWRLKYKVIMDKFSVCNICKRFYYDPSDLPETKVYVNLTEYWVNQCPGIQKDLRNMLYN